MHYPWPRIRRCPRCGGTRLWGHGFVPRYFDGYPTSLLMKRWRCPDCRAVHTARPKTHWRRFWAEWRTILRSLLRKQHEGTWRKDTSRQRQQYWRHGWVKQTAYSGTSMPLEEMLRSGIVLATHSLLDREIHVADTSPYRSFALTDASLPVYPPP